MNHFKKPCLDNLVEYFNLIAHETNGFIIQTESVTAAITHLNANIFNAVLKFRAESYAHIKKEILTRANNASLPISFWLDDAASSDEKNFIDALKLNYFGHIPMMVIETRATYKTSLPDDIKIIKYEADNLSEWMVPFHEGFQFDAGINARLQAVFEKKSAPFCHFAAIKQNKIVGCASLYTGGEFAGFYNLAVLPSYRNQGIGKALKLARLQHAKSLGFEYATLQSANSLAVTIDKKFGFEETGGFHLYLDEIF